MSNQNFVTVHTKIVQNLVFTDFLVIYVQNSRFFAFLLNFFERYFITVFLKIYRTVFEKRFTISDTKYLSNFKQVSVGIQTNNKQKKLSNTISITVQKCHR